MKLFIQKNLSENVPYFFNSTGYNSQSVQKKGATSQKNPQRGRLKGLKKEPSSFLSNKKLWILSGVVTLVGLTTLAIVTKKLFFSTRINESHLKNSMENTHRSAQVLNADPSKTSPMSPGKGIYDIGLNQVSKMVATYFYTGIGYLAAVAVTLKIVLPYLKKGKGDGSNKTCLLFSEESLNHGQSPLTENPFGENIPKDVPLLEDKSGMGVGSFGAHSAAQLGSNSLESLQQSISLTPSQDPQKSSEDQGININNKLSSKPQTSLPGNPNAHKLEISKHTVFKSRLVRETLERLRNRPELKSESPAGEHLLEDKKSGKIHSRAPSLAKSLSSLKKGSKSKSKSKSKSESQSPLGANLSARKEDWKNKEKSKLLQEEPKIVEVKKELEPTKQQQNPPEIQAFEKSNPKPTKEQSPLETEFASIAHSSGVLFFGQSPEGNYREVNFNYGPIDKFDAGRVFLTGSEERYLAAKKPENRSLKEFFDMAREKNFSNVIFLDKMEVPISETINTDQFSYWQKSDDSNFLCHKIDDAENSPILRIFEFPGWLDHQMPSPELLVKFVKFINEKKLDNQGLLVICRDGLGKTGTFIAANHIVTQKENPKGEKRDRPVKEIVREIRCQRHGAVTTFDQYKLLNEISLSS